MPTIIVRDAQGMEMPIKCSELVSVDGKPYRENESLEELVETVAYLRGKVDFLEAFLGDVFQLNPEGDDTDG